MRGRSVIVSGVDSLVRLQQPQEMEGAVEHADIRVGGNDGGAPAARTDRSNQVSLAANRPEVSLQPKRRDDR